MYNKKLKICSMCKTGKEDFELDKKSLFLQSHKLPLKWQMQQIQAYYA